MFFKAFDQNSGYELWVSDGTTNGTFMIRDINADTTGSVNVHPFYVKNSSGLLYFAADDGINGQELWVTDGTYDGTNMVANFNSNLSGIMFRTLGTNFNPVFFNGDLILNVNDGNGNQLVSLELSDDGTIAVIDHHIFYD